MKDAIALALLGANLALTIYLLIRSHSMATKQEVLDAIAAERAEVQTKLDALVARIAELEAAGAGATAADLAEIKAGIEGIFTPA